MWTKHCEDCTQDTFQGRKATLTLHYFTDTPQISTLLEPEAGRIQSCSTKKTKQVRSVYELTTNPSELGMVLGTKHCNNRALSDQYHRLVAVVENPKVRYATPLPSIAGVVHLLLEQEDWKRTCPSKIWLVNNDINLDTYYSVY